MHRIVLGDNLAFLPTLADESVDLVYIDPPFNTGKVQRRKFVKTNRDPEGDRTGFKGARFRTKVVSEAAFTDTFEDYWAFLAPRLEHAHRVLKPTGSLYFHIDYRESAYCRVGLDRIFGRQNFLNEIIWAYDYGARSQTRWSAKHDNILFYVKDHQQFYFDYEEVDRIPYMAPDLVGPEKAARGKTVTDVWWHTIVSPTGKEKLGYPTQKPLGILRRIVKVSCPSGGVALDFFAGSGTLGAAALETGRNFILVDNSSTAFEVMRRRFSGKTNIEFVILPGNGGPDSDSD